MLSVQPPQRTAAPDGVPTDTHPLFPVGPFKFAAMSLCTLGLYEYYWAYQQWKRIREREREDLSPFWRAVFHSLWAFSLLPRIHAYSTGQRVTVGWSAGLLALLHFALFATWRLPDPWSLLSLLAFVPLLPVVVTIEAVNRGAGALEDHNHSFSTPNFIGGVIGGCVLVLALIGTFLPE
jgi:hypothetical protein